MRFTMGRFLHLVLVAGVLLLAPAFAQAQAQADLMIVVTKDEAGGRLKLTVFVKNLGPAEYKMSQGRTVTLSLGGSVPHKITIPDLKKEQAYRFEYPVVPKPAKLKVRAEISPGDDNRAN